MTFTPSARQTILLLGLLLGVYAALTSWRMHLAPFPLHHDACWYDMVARNWAHGQGLTETALWHFALMRDTAVGPIGNYWNPLAPLILGIFYRLFGFSDAVGCAPAFLMDALLVALLFIFFRKRLGASISFVATLLFIVHPYALTLRAGGGFPETYLMFFVTLTCLALIKAAEGKPAYYAVAGVLGSLGYLARNEGGLSLLALLAVFGIAHLSRRSQKTPLKPLPWKWLAMGTALFFAVALPWEWRNHAVFGEQANRAKISFFFARHYEDIWSITGLAGPREFLALGPRVLLQKLLVSYIYKMDYFFNVLSWSIVLWLPLGLLRLRGQMWWKPVGLYFLITYIVMGALNTVGQQAGWHGSYTFLPFFLFIAVLGMQGFAKSIASPPWYRLIFWGLAAFVVFYQAADTFRVLHRRNIENPDARRTLLTRVGAEVRAHSAPGESPTVLTHFAYELSYYSGLPAVRIPTNDSLDVIWDLARRTHCTHLALIGNNSPVFEALYSGQQTFPFLEKIWAWDVPVPLEHGGDHITLYRIRFPENPS